MLQPAAENVLPRVGKGEQKAKPYPQNPALKSLLDFGMKFISEESRGVLKHARTVRRNYRLSFPMVDRIVSLRMNKKETESFAQGLVAIGGMLLSSLQDGKFWHSTNQEILNALNDSIEQGILAGKIPDKKWIRNCLSCGAILECLPPRDKRRLPFSYVNRRCKNCHKKTLDFGYYVLGE